MNSPKVVLVRPCCFKSVFLPLVASKVAPLNRHDDRYFFGNVLPLRAGRRYR